MTDLELAGWKYRLWEFEEADRTSLAWARAVGVPTDPEVRQRRVEAGAIRAWLREEARFMVILGEIQCAAS